jgi:hypothetical protein
MMEGNNIATLYDKRGRNDIEIEINKNDKQQDYVEFRVKDKHGDWIKSDIGIKELYGMIFLLVDKEQQAELMPVRQTQVRIYERQHRIKLKKDMKRGEIVVANCRVEVPLIVEEGLAGLIKSKARRISKIIIPSKNW